MCLIVSWKSVKKNGKIKMYNFEDNLKKLVSIAECRAVTSHKFIKGEGVNIVNDDDFMSTYYGEKMAQETKETMRLYEEIVAHINLLKGICPDCKKPVIACHCDDDQYALLTTLE